jgi:hypothetical protein
MPDPLAHVKNLAPMVGCPEPVRSAHAQVAGHITAVASIADPAQRAWAAGALTATYLAAVEDLRNLANADRVG